MNLNSFDCNMDIVPEADAVATAVPAVRRAGQVSRKPIATGKISKKALEQKSDPELISDVHAGDKRAFDVLVCRHQPMIISTLLRMMDHSDAQDVAQETFIKAYRSLHSFRGDSQFATWLYRIATNTAMHHLKSRRRRSAAVQLDALDHDRSGYIDAIVDINTPEALAIADELHGKIERCLNRLKPSLQGAIVSYEIDGMSYQEIADRMDCPVGTIRSRISRSREILDTELSAHAFEPLVPRYCRRNAASQPSE